MIKKDKGSLENNFKLIFQQAICSVFSMYFNQHLLYLALVVLTLLVNQSEGASTNQPATSGPEENTRDVEIAGICLGVGLTLLVVLLITLLVCRADRKLKKAAKRTMEMRRRQQSGHENLATAIEEIDEKDTTDQQNTHL